MRGLNLSRLARASEASFFKDRQASQASELRKTLTPAQVKEAKVSKSPHDPTVDVLPEILAHSASKNIVTSATATPRADVRPYSVRITRADSYPAQTTVKNQPPILRTLGSGRLSVYANLKEESVAHVARPLPGSANYADGALIGMASFSIASAIVASTGLVGGLYVYFNPSVVDNLRQRTVHFRGWLDLRVGQPIRARVHERWESGPVFSESTMHGATSLARAAVGVHVTEHQGHQVETSQVETSHVSTERLDPEQKST